MTCSRISRRVLGLAALGAWLGMPSTSQAHFVLTSPPAMYQQNGLGDPQKAPPCGNHMDMAEPTGEVTAVQAGDTITISIDETIYHPGHYRIALALDGETLPEPPPVTPGDTPCGSAPIDPAPVFPVLADGVLVHTAPFGAPQTFDVTIPEDVSCTNCTLQIIQFMSDHALNDPGGCYYHHCAVLSIEPSASGSEGTTAPGDDSGGGSSSDGGPQVTTGVDGTAGPGETSAPPGGDSDSGGALPTTDTDTTPASDDEDGGCSCRAPAEGMQGGLGMLLGLLGLAALRRRRA